MAVEFGRLKSGWVVASHLPLFAARFSFMEPGELLVKTANRGISGFLSHFSALRGAFQVERTIVFDAHCPSPARRQCRFADS